MLAVIGIASGVLGVGFGVLQWRRLTSQGEELQTAITQRADARKSMEHLQGESQKIKEKLDLTRAQLKKAEKAAEDSNQKQSDLSLRLRSAEELSAASEKKLNLKIEDLTEQLASVKQQLADNVSELQALKKSKADAGMHLKNQESHIRAESETRLNELREKLRASERNVRDLQKQNADLAEQIKKANPRDILVMRKKVSQYNTLYNSMRGLREMSEERNENLEFALRKLALWALKKQGKDADPSAKFGALVGAALQSIGSSLVLDEHTLPPERGESSEQSESSHAAAQPPFQQAHQS